MLRFLPKAERSIIGLVVTMVRKLRANFGHRTIFQPALQAIPQHGCIPAFPAFVSHGEIIAAL
jgi:hypothetical protein